MDSIRGAYISVSTNHYDISMQIYHFNCDSCKYESKLPLGSSDLDQVLTDTNTDYAEYRLFKCEGEAMFMNADIHDRDFVGKCPSDSSKLIEIDEKIRPIRCPRCNQTLHVETSSPLEETAKRSLVN